MNNEIKHHGVLGMRWGKRKSRPTSSDYKVASKLKKKRVEELSNEELRTLSNRLDLEKKYKQINPNKVEKGKRAVDRTITAIGKLTAAVTGVAALIALGQKIYTKIPKGG